MIGAGSPVRASLKCSAKRAVSIVAEVTTFWVQAGSFPDQIEAGRIADSLSGWVRADRGAGRFNVVVGPWDSANAAEAARQSVVARGYAGALLISGS